MCLNLARLALLLAPTRLELAYIVPLPFFHPKPHSLYYPCKARAHSENALYKRRPRRSAMRRRRDIESLYTNRAVLERPSHGH